MGRRSHRRLPGQDRSAAEILLYERVAKGIATGKYPDGPAALAAWHAGLKRLGIDEFRIDKSILEWLRKRARNLGWDPGNGYWSADELRIVDRHSRLVLRGRFSSVRAASGPCALELRRLRQAPAPPGARPRARTLVAVQICLGQRTHALGMARPNSAWTPTELAVIDRYARRFMHGHYPELQLAARDCARELARVRKSGPDAARQVAARSSIAVREGVRQRVRKLGGRTSLRHWSRRELRIIERYARATAAGRYRSVPEAARHYLAEVERLRKRYPDAAWLAARHSEGAVRQVVYDCRKRLGLSHAPAAIWRAEERRLLDRHARAFIAERYPHGRAAAEALGADLMALWKRNRVRAGGVPRTLRAVRSQFWKRVRELGHALTVFAWSPEELTLVRRHARRLLLGHYRGRGDAAQACHAELAELHRRNPAKPWARERRTLGAIRLKLWQAARACGVIWSDSRWTPAENRILDRYALAVVRGRIACAGDAVHGCARELAQYHRTLRMRVFGQPGRPGPRTRRAILNRIELRARALGRPARPGPWTPAEVKLARQRSRDYRRRRGPGGLTLMKAAALLAADIAKVGGKRTTIACWMRLQAVGREHRRPPAPRST